MSRKRVAVLISGRGSNLQALLDAEQDAYEIVLVVSNAPDAEGLTRAAQAGVEALTLDHRPYGKNREAFERDLDSLLIHRNIELVVLAGFMRVLTPFFVHGWKDRLINIHPSLLPKYPGTKTHERVLENGDAEHGCTVHLVVEDVDSGPILGQAKLRVQPGDTSQTLADRVLELEHALYPRCVAAYARSLGGRP
ncbi:MAG: phosphoribosylglycinamide formyltransferase [Hyphomonadaceae bacterium]|nr:phosphoribosylglycinamide formyltransferase [Hyphomonadaceae bacterium]